MNIRRTAAVGCLIPALAIGVAACGSNSKSSSSSSGGSSSGSSGGGTVDVYSSLPLQGASKDQTAAIVQGMRLALDQAGNKAGNTTVKYTSLDDSTQAAGNWDPQQVGANARKAVQDKKTVAYLGEFNSGATVLSLPVLNGVGIAQLSPSATSDGITTTAPDTSKGEPEKYYPSGKRTFFRIVPRDIIQSADIVTQAKQDGCKKVAVANDQDTYGGPLAKLIVLNVKKLGLQLASNTGIQKDAANFRAYASKIKGQGADCFVFAGVTANGAVQIAKDVHAAIPTAKLYGGDGICESGFMNPKKKGIPSDVGKLFKCTVATQDLTAYPGGKKFLADFKAKYGNSNPDPYAIYGYELMQLTLDTIKAGGTDRASFLQKVAQTKDRNSVLGKYSFDKNGDTTQTSYGVYVVGPDGNPKFDHAIQAGQS